MQRMGGRWISSGTQAAVMAALLCALLGCVGVGGISNLQLEAAGGSTNAIDHVRNVDISPRFPAAIDGSSGTTSEPSQPLIFPGSATEPEPQRGQDPETRIAAQSASVRGEGVEINFDGADVQTVAKTLLGDVLKLNFVIDPRV